MRDYLLDIVQHTYGLGVISLIKVVGTEDTTTINAFDKETKTVVLNAEFKKAIPDFIGTFGMPNLDRLNTILGLPPYKDDAKITVTRQDDGPSGINFENKDGDFKNNFRFMGEALINDQLKNVVMKQVKWNVDIVPTVQAIQKLKFQAMAHSDATAFSTKTENGDLKFYFGDHSSHAGSFVFAAGCGGSLSKQLYWPVAVVNSIFSLPGDKTFKISDEGVAEITVDSGLAVYHYKLPAQTK
jgi:hypothetical protein